MPSFPVRSIRHPVDLPVFILYRKRRFLGTRARHLSVGGIDVEAPRALTLPPGTLVELELNHGGERHRLPAFVTRSDRQGIGLRFRDPQPELLRELVTTHELEIPPPMALGRGEVMRASL